MHLQAYNFSNRLYSHSAKLKSVSCVMDKTFVCLNFTSHKSLSNLSSSELTAAKLKINFSYFNIE